MRYLLFIGAMMSLFSSTAQPKKVMPRKAFELFVKAINVHDVKAISSLMTDNHIFIDATGNKVEGRDKVSAGWEGYFKWFPDYKIEVSRVLVNGDTIAAYGFTGGSYGGVKGNSWRIPASWQAVVSNGKISLWQVYADTKIPFDIVDRNTVSANTQPRVTGVGGIFFKCKEPAKVKSWYKEHLYLNMDKYGTNFEWRQGDDPSKYGFTQWSAFSDKTTYFKPSEKDFMINYRVANLEALVGQLRRDSVTVVDTMETVSYGKFIHILDCEGNKIELWEPVDTEYNKMVGGRTK